MDYETSAKSLYESLRFRRDPFLRRAENAAAVTIPMLVPRERHGSSSAHQEFDTPQQSIGARGVNHLAARLNMSLMPPNAPFFRLDMDREARGLLAEDPEQATEVDGILRDIEDEVAREIEVRGMRATGNEIMKNLVVAGNAMQFFPEGGGMSFFPLSQYVVERDGEGDKEILIIIKEVLTKRALPADVQAMVNAMRSDLPAESASLAKGEDVEIYTRIWLTDEGRYSTHQELADGSIIPDSDGSYSEDELPYKALRWTVVHGEAYGRGHVEEMMGDMISLEGLAGAILDGALAASRLVGMVKPNGTTYAADINKAQNGEFISGNAEDVTFLQIAKQADFRMVAEAASSIERRVEAAFLLNSSVIRDAERVTAEEIRFVAQELESTLGGVFSLLAQEFQLPMAKRILAQLRKEKRIPEFTGEVKDHVKPVIVTGVDALGRSADLDRVRAAFATLQGMVGPEQVAASANLDVLIKYVFTQAGVRISGLTKTREQMAQEAQQQQQQALLQSAVDKGTGPAVNAVSQATQQASPQE